MLNITNRARASVHLATVRKGWTNRIKSHPREPILSPNSDSGRIRLGMIQRCNCNVDGLRVFIVLKEQRRPATTGKRAQSVGVANLAQLSRKELDIIPGDLAPSHKRCRARPPAIDTMTITQTRRGRVQPITNPAAQTTPLNFCAHSTPGWVSLAEGSLPLNSLRSHAVIATTPTIMNFFAARIAIQMPLKKPSFAAMPPATSAASP